MALEIKLALAPVLNDDGTGDARLSLNRQTLQPLSFNLDNENMAENLVLGLDRNLFSFEADTQNVIENRLVGGDVRTTRIGPPRRNVVIDLSCLPAAKMRVLDQMLATGRPLAVGAWYDQTTMAMSHLSGRHPRLLGVNEIGLCNQYTIQRRDNPSAGPEAMDWTPHPFGGDSAHFDNSCDDVTLARRLKLTPGMIGPGARFDSGERYNLATPRYCTSITVAAEKMFPTEAGSADVKRMLTGGSPIPTTAFKQGTAYVEHISVGPAGKTTDYVETGIQGNVVASSVYCMGLLLRGAGTITMEWYNVGVASGNLKVITLTPEWQWYWLENFTPTSSTARLRVYGGSASPAVQSGAMFQCAVMQIEPGRTPTSWMDYTVAPGSKKTDAIFLDEDLPPAWTFCFWHKYTGTADEQRIAMFYKFASGPTLGFVVQLRGSNVEFLDLTSGGATTSSFTIPNAANLKDTWMQVVVSWGPATGSATHLHRKTCWVNGVNLGTSQNVTVITPSVAEGFRGELRLFGDDGGYLGATVSSAINTVVDCYRIDGKVWTDAEVLDDYDMRSQEGMRHFLQKVQGRYFRPAVSFGTWGPLIDLNRGVITLREVAVAPQSAYGTADFPLHV